MGKTITFFHNYDKTVDFLSLTIEYRTFLIFLLMGVVAIGLFFLSYVFVSRLIMEKRLREKNIKVRRKRKREYTLWKKFLKHFDKEELELRFIHSGGILGIKTVEVYVIYRIVFVIVGLILGIELYQPHDLILSIIILLGCGVLGWLVVDFILYQGKKDRIKSIKSQMPMFLMSFDNYIKAGLLFEDVLDIMPKLIHGSFRDEIVRFNMSYSLSKDFEGTLKEFIRRLGVPEADEIELKLRQCYYSGIYDDVLENEKEMIERKVINDMKKETQMYDLYLALAMGLMVFNLFILVIIPIFNVASEGYRAILG